MSWEATFCSASSGIRCEGRYSDERRMRQSAVIINTHGPILAERRAKEIQHSSVLVLGIIDPQLKAEYFARLGIKSNEYFHVR